MDTTTTTEVALVTGANKGIGFEICRQLLQQRKLVLLLGARNAELGQQAVDALKKEFAEAKVELVSIDLDQPTTIQKAAEVVQERYGGLDILVNNAGFAHKGNTLNEEIASSTIKSNYFGTRVFCIFLLCWSLHF